ncbi:MAG TPA: AAA family ATPase [Candidatus Dormibacteraeota bacterium]
MNELLEREAELERATRALARAAAGAGAVLVVEGPPGIGKTAFANAVARHAATAGMTVLSARGSEAERDFAFGTVRQLFERRVTGARRRHLLAGAARCAASLFAPASAARAPAEGRLHPLLHGLYWLCVNLTGAAPLLLVVDDAQWADEPSLRFCEYLGRRLGELPAVLLLTARSAVASPRVAGLAAGGDLLRLAPLTDGAVAALVGADDAALAAACARVTGGNPFLVRELLRWLGAVDARGSADIAGAAPPTVQAWITARLDRCAPGARAVARCAAVLEPRADLDLVAELAGLDAGEAAAHADELAAAAILRAGRPCAFAHPLVRSAALATLAEGERAALHRRAAELLARRGAEPVEVARHLADADPVGEPWAAAALCAAADGALRHGDPAAAAGWLRRALAEPAGGGPRADLLRRLGVAEHRLGHAGAIPHLREAFALADDPAARAEVLRALLLSLLGQGRADEVARMLDATLPALAGGDPDLAVRLEAEVLSAARHTLTEELWVAGRLRAWRGRARPDSAGGRLLLANLATQCALDGEPAEAAAALAEAALAGGRLLQEQTADAMPVYQAIWQLTAAERLDPAGAALRAALADSRRRGSILGFATASLFLSYVELAAGRVAGAEAHAAAALDAARQASADWFAVPAVVAGVVDVHVEQARPADAERLLEEMDLAGPVGDSVPLRLLLHSRGLLHLAAGRPERAADDLLELARREGRLQALSTHLAPHQVSVALALAAAGRTAEAEPWAAAGLAAARAWGAPRTVARALRAAARLRGPGGAAALLAEAAALLERSPARLDEAWIRLDLGAALARTGRRAAAAAELRRALDLGHACGGAAVERAARDELVACGYRPRRAASSGVDALTGSERGVAAMAARGMANRAIAQALFVTERTVELHLTNVYRKLGISSRRGLAAALEPRPPGRA